MSWWTRLFLRKDVEAQLEKELRFHLEEHASDLIARGYPPDQARRQARLALGGPEQVKERCRDARGTRWLEDAVRDARYALRTFRQKPGFAAVAVMTLALGIGATTAMFTVVNSVLLKPLPFPESEKLVALHGFMDQFGEFWGFSNPDFDDVRQESRSLAVVGWTYGGGTISSPGQPEYVDGTRISAGLLSTLGIAPLRGRTFRSEEDRPGAAPVAIISDGFWRRRFGGDPSAVGSTLVFEGTPYTVIGIVPACVLLGDSDVFTPLARSDDPRMRNREARFLHVVGRLRPGVKFAKAQSEVALIGRHLAEQYPKSNKGVALRLQPLRQELVGNVGATLWLLLAAVGSVLLVACLNIASLFLTRAISREREMAMRVALGAGWGRIARQSLAESIALGLCGGLAGILLARVCVHPFVKFWPGNLPRAEEIHLDWRVFAFGLGVSLLSSLLFGLAPVLRVPLSGLEPALRSAGRTVTGASRRVYSILVVSEIALAFVLLTSAGMLGNTLLTLSSLAPGFNAHNVLTARFAISPGVLQSPAEIRAAWQDVLDRARRLPEVRFAALADIIPMREGENSLPYRATAAPLPRSHQPVALASCVTPDYLRVMGIPLLEGRFFDEHDREESKPVVVVDENLARRAFGRQNVVGRRLWIPAMGAAPVEIVGVVGHVRHWGLAGDEHARVRDQMYYPFAQVPAPLLHFFSSVMSIAVRTKTPPLTLVEPLRIELRGASQDQALYEPRTMEQLVSASLARQRFLLVLFGLFAAIALLLASIGIYGVLAYLTGQRVAEIGVRMALGATIRDVMTMVLRQSVGMVFIGVGVGTFAALAAAHVLQRFVQGMQPVHIATFAIMIPLLLATALAASFVPARRASRVDPLSALRRE